MGAHPRWRESAVETVCRVWTRECACKKGSDEFNGVSLKLVDERTIEESDLNNGKVVKISRWALAPDGQTLHARFDDTHGHIQEQDGHKVKWGE